jgi:hypothetical protein
MPTVETAHIRLSEVRQLTTGERLVADAKSIVTLQAVRVANGKMMSAARSAAPSPVTPAPRVVLPLKAVADGGQRAMQALRKP